MFVLVAVVVEESSISGSRFEEKMAHFAKIFDGIVETVVVVSNDDCGDQFPSSEPIGQAFIASLGLDGEWKQTSYNNNFRKQYAGIGFTYDADADVFVSPQPFPSWSLDSNHDWQAPTTKPEGDWIWDESKLLWVEVLVG
jgi:hypothetical protein